MDIESFINMIRSMVSKSGLSKYIGNIEYRDGKIYLELNIESLGIEAKQVDNKIRIKVRQGMR